jgi:hypothetical protein
MKQAFTILLSGVLLTYSFSQAGGNGVSNGGDSVECVKSSLSPYVGFYNLDYLANIIARSSLAAEFSKAVPHGSPPEIQMQRVIATSKKTLPAFSEALQTYHDSLYQNSYSEPYSWKMAPYGLNEIDDENLHLSLPANCQQNGHSKPYIQTIIRTQLPHQIQFTLFQTAFEKLDSLQKSFLLMHEWLWSFTQDAEVVRNANAVLHSEWNENNAAYKLAILYLVGFDFNAIGMKVSELRLGVQEDKIVCPQEYGYCVPSGSNKTYEIEAAVNSTAAVLRFKNQTSSKDIYLIPATVKKDIANARFVKLQPGSEFALMSDWKRKAEVRYCLVLVASPSSGIVPDFSNAANVGPEMAVCPKGTLFAVVGSR